LVKFINRGGLIGEKQTSDIKRGGEETPLVVDWKFPNRGRRVDQKNTIGKGLPANEKKRTGETLFPLRRQKEGAPSHWRESSRRPGSAHGIKVLSLSGEKKTSIAPVRKTQSKSLR